MQQVGKGVGVATAASLLNLTLAWRGGTELTSFEFQVAFFVSAAMSLMSILFFLPLQKYAGSEMSGHKRRSRDEAGETVSPSTK